MKRKLNIFTLVFALIFSLHSGVYAMEETDPNNAEIVENVSSQTPSTENDKEQEENAANSQEDADKDHSQGLEASKEETPSPVSNPQPQGKSNEDDPAADPDPAGDEDTDPAADGNESDPADTPGENPDQGEDPKKEIDVSTNEDLKNLDEQIKNEKDPKKIAELEKKYNEKYAELLEGSGKLDDSVLDRIKDKERTDRYYELKAEYDAIKEKLKKEDPNSEENTKLREELDKLNQELAGYKIPRLLEDDEKEAKKGLDDSVDVPGLKEKTPEAEKALEDYTKAKKDLEKALNPENPRTTSPEELKQLLDAYTKARDALRNGIKDGKIKPSYTDGDPKIRIFKLNGGSIGEELDKKENEIYYIPDNTSLNLLVDIKKDDDPQNFKFKIKADEVDIEKLNASAENLVSLNDKGLKLEKDEDGSYYFTINDPETFGIAQLHFNIPAFRAAFHKGFDLVIDANGKETIKKFRITKKGYEDDAKIEGPGSEKNDDPKTIPEIDAGKTQDSKVVESTDKVHDFFTYLKKSNTYIDDVFINSSSGESLPLSSVDITITVPKNQEGEFAEMIHKAGLVYDDIGGGQYRLKLDTKLFDGNLTQDDQGNLFYNDKKIEKSDLRDVILEKAGKKVYVDENGKTREIKKEEYLEGGNYKVQDNRLYEKDGDNYKEIGKFDENGRIEKGDKVYELKEGTLTHYDKVNVYEGKVVNTDGKANPNLTPSPDGKQVVIENEGKKSYGGTIVDNAIYNSEGKIVKNDGYQVKSGNIIIGDDGKAVDGITFNEKDIKEENGIKTVKVGDKTYRVVTNPVFNDKGYIVDGLSYAEGPSLVDKYGKKMKIDVKDNGDGTYTFTRKVIKDGKEEDESKTTGQDNISISADEEVIVDSTNRIVEPSDKNEIIRDKYFYNGTKFEKFDPKTEKLNPQSKETYDGGKELPAGKKIYQGSTNPDDYYKAGEDLYVKKTQGSKNYYVSADPNSDGSILSEGKIAKIVQTIKKDGKDVEVVTDEASIFDAVANAKFGLRFPKFLAGKNIVYNVHTDIKAAYIGADGKEVSIFKEGSKEADKYFTLKNSQSTETLFFKNNPKELEKVPDYNFFNIFYRNSDDRKRDELIRDLLKEKADSGKPEEKPSQDKKLSDEEKDKIKEKTAKMALLDKVQKELARLYDGAQFALAKDENGELILDDEGKPKLVILDKDGKETDIDRALLWEIGFNNSKDSIFPENTDTKIIIEDHHLDNRLVYDEIIVNDTEENWKDLKEKSEKAKKAYEAAKKAYEADKSDANKEKMDAAKEAFEKIEFEGSKNYFYLNQIGEINFGVNPTYTEGRFAPIGDDFTLTGEEIIKALGNNSEATITKDNGITYKITRNKKKGQVRISVINAFYKKADPASENKFSSPVQEAYGKKIESIKSDIDSLDSADTDGLKTAFANIVDGFVSDEDQKAELKAKFNKLMDDFAAKTFDDEESKKQAFNKIKSTLKAELDKLPLSYLDKSKGEYKNDDFRFNSIRIALKDSIRLGGPLSPETNKKLGITSVVIPDVDIPYTDEYGKVMTNKYMYVKEEIENILKEGINGKKYTKYDLNNEEKFQEILREAYKRVNDNDKITIKDLVEIKDKDKLAWEKYSALAGKNLDYEDLAPIKDKNGNAINPWYIGDVPASDKFDDKLKQTQAYKDLENKKIDLPAYYMAKNGYDRRTYANKAGYKLDKVDQAEGIFGKEDSSKKKSYYPTIGYIIDETSKAAGLKEDGEDKDADKFGAEGKNDSKFELDYEPDSTNSNSENPKVEKSVSDDTIDIAGDEDKKVDFTIDVTVDKMTKDQKDLANAMEEKTEDESQNSSEDDSFYGPNGYYIYKNSVIIDILPKIFNLKEGSKLELEIDKTKLMAGGANANFDNEENFKKFKDGIKYFYTDDLDAEIKRLESGDENDKKKAEILRKAKKDSGKTFKEGEKIQAIIAYLPDFEAPHGSTSQFIFRLKDIYIDKKAYKDYDDDVIGTDYTNKAGFGDKSKFYYGDAKVNVNQGPDGKVNKYLQILDENGNVVDKDIADGWFKGNAKVKFGDKFNYRIKYRRNSGVVQIGGDPTYTTELNIKDILAGVKDGGLRAILRDFVTSDLEGFEVIYKVGDTEYTKEDIENGKAKLSDVTSLILKSGDKGYVDGSTVNFYLPMQIPTMDAKIEDGKIVYVGKDGKEIIGNAEDFFDLDSLKDPKKDLLAENTVEDSNTVGVYLDKNRFLKVFKEFFDKEGEKITKDRPQVEFEIYQIETDKNGDPILDEKDQEKKVLLVDKDGNPIKLIANEANNFESIIENLPLYKKTVEIGKNGEIVEKIVRYDYQIKEAKADGYIVEIKKVDGDKLGFVFEVKNTEEPEKPEEPETPDDKPKDDGEKPKDEPKEDPKDNPKDDPKDNPKDNPENPDDKPEDKTKTPDEPSSPDQPYKPGSPHSPKLPQTGAINDLSMVYVSGSLLAIAAYIRRKIRD